MTDIHTLADIELHIGRLGHRVDALCKFYTPGHDQLTHGRRKSGGRDFGTDHNATVEWGEKWYGSWQKGLSVEDHKNITDSQIAGSEHLNNFSRFSSDELDRRFGGNFTDERKGRMQEMQGRVDKLIESAPKTSEDIHVYRGMDSRFAGKSGDLVGSDISDKGFMSTSMLRDVALRFLRPDDEKRKTLFKIRIPKGSAGMPMKGFGEAEFLLPRNSKLKILDTLTKRTPDGKSFVNINAELLT